MRLGGVLRMIFAEGMLPVDVGIGIGVAASVWLGGTLSSLLFEIDPLDLGTTSPSPRAFLGLEEHVDEFERQS